MVGCLLGGLYLPLADSFRPAAVAGPEAEQTEDDLADVLHDLCALPGYVLADRAELRGCCRESAYCRQRWNSCVHYRSGGRDLAVGRLLHDATASASVDQRERSSR